MSSWECLSLRGVEAQHEVLLQLRFLPAMEQELPGAILADTLEVLLHKQPGAHAMVWLQFDH